tara:strand:+ start:4942 stop:5232 length:291 start_codon:yes stop_codon:yes gene_type:complete
MYNKTTLSHVPNLINDYRKYAVEACNDKDMVELYEDDAAGFLSALGMFRNNKLEELKTFVDYMDTAPREEIVIAFGKDLGSDWVRSVLGYDVKGWV